MPPTEYPIRSNEQLIPIYTDWANRCLVKSGAAPIANLTRDLRKPSHLLRLVTVVAPPGSTELLTARVRKKTDDATALSDIVAFLERLGVDCAKVNANQIAAGHLGSLLQLLFALSQYRHEQRSAARREQREREMSAAAVQSRLPAPSPRIGQSKIASPRSLAPPSPAPSSAAHPHPPPSGLRAPSGSPATTATSRLSRPTSKIAAPSSASSSVASGSYASIPSATSAPRAQSSSRLLPPSSSLKEPTAQKKEPAKSSSGLRTPSSTLTKSIIKAPDAKVEPAKKGLRPPSTGLRTPSSSSRSPAISPQPKPRDLNLAPTAAAAAPVAPKAAAPAASGTAATNAAPEALATPPQQQKSIPAPSKMLKMFGKEKKKAEPSSQTPVTSKLKRPGLRPPTVTAEKKPDPVQTRMLPVKIAEEEEEKRSSKSSVDSAYGELSASSSSPSTSSTSSTADVNLMQVSPLVDKPSSMPSYSASANAGSRLAVPTAAVAAAPDCPAPSPIAEKPTLAVKGTPMRAEPESPEIDSPTIVEELVDSTSKSALDKRATTTEQEETIRADTEKSAPAARVETSPAFATPQIPPPPPPVTAPTMFSPPRQPPSYSQLCKSGRISVPIGESQEEGPRGSGLSGGSDAAAADMIRRASGAPAHPQRTRPANELIYTNSSMMLQDDSSDSSSVSSDDFCDGSSIISGTQSDYMATAFALGRTSSQMRSGRSSSMGERQRHLVDQENINALLKQCKTSKRSEAYQQPWPFSHQEGTPIDLPPRLNGLASNGFSGLHSLERKSRVAHLYRDDNGDRSALSALLSPRRMPPPSSSTDRHSLSGSLKRHENIYANAAALRDGELSLHKTSLPCSPSHTLRQSAERDFKGSQLSLASSCAFSTADTVDVDRLVRDLEGYHRKVNSLQRSNHNYEAVMDTVHRRVEKIAKVVGRDDTITSDEAARLRAEIESIRLVISRANTGGVRVTEPVQIDGLTRQPSLESVASARSSMSSASKSSALGFGVKGQKKSWFRSSLTKAFHKNGNKKDKKEGVKEAEEIAVSHLKKQLADKECALNDVRLDAVISANSVLEMQEQLHRLKSENQQLRSELRYQQNARSRASSRASIPVDEDVYDIPPSSSRSSASSKRSSGCGAVRVSVNVDLHGALTTTVSPEEEISIGYVALPATDVNWSQLDAQLFVLFQEYLTRIDPENTLGLHAAKSVIGYQIGEVCRHILGKPQPVSAPFETITTTSTIRMFLRGAAQHEVDSLVLSTLFPRGIADKLMKDLKTNRRLLLCGATGIGKSKLARQLAALLSARMGLSQNEGIQEIRMTEDSSAAQAQLQLDRLLSSSSPSVILIDNIPRPRVALISSSIAAAKLAPDQGPYVICTVNRASQSPESGTAQIFNTFIVTSRNEGVRGFTGRFLRRRLVEQEYRSCSTVPSEMLRIIDFMTTVLGAVNAFIEKANSLDVTVGPRTFCACPLSVEESRAWFVQLWNENLVPYMSKVANEGIKVLGRSVSYDDPTDAVCDAWPWVDGEPGETALIRLLSYAQVQLRHEKPTNFNAFDALTKIRSRQTETC